MKRVSNNIGAPPGSRWTIAKAAAAKRKRKATNASLLRDLANELRRRSFRWVPA